MHDNYFKYSNQYYKQQEGVAVGAPMSAILLETLIDNLENHQILHILTKRNILNYSTYVGGILIT